MSLPENGCRFHNDCFACPFADCIIGTGKSGERMIQQRLAKELSQSGLNVDEIALKLEKSNRRIRRYLEGS